MANQKRLADVNALLEEIERTIEIMEQRREHFSLRNLIMCIKNAPTVDAVEVVHGKWVRSIFAEDFHRCSVCSSVWNRTFKYCPNCGAKMDGDSNG